MSRPTGFPAVVREQIRERSGGRCEIRWACDGDTATQIHHRRPRGMGGSRRPSTNLASNGINACTLCHRWVETEGREIAQQCGWLVSQYTDDPEAVPVMVNRKWTLLGLDGSVVVLPAGEFPGWMTPGRSA